MTRACTAASISWDRDEICRAVSRGNGAIPPTRWQPVHFSRTTGATSRLKLGVADGAACRSLPCVVARAASGIPSASRPATASAALVPMRLCALGVIGAPDVA
jgi:hypothetical protein